MVGLATGLSLPIAFLEGGPRGNDCLALRSVLVLGGSSALGASVIQLLRIAAPDCQILATAAPKHHALITGKLGAHKAINRASSSLAADVQAATRGHGVDAILDAVGAGANERHIFDCLRADGPKRYAQVWTGDAEIQVPQGVDSVLFRSRDYGQIPGGENIFRALEVLLQNGMYKAPLPTRIVGAGHHALEKGLNLMRHGVSGEKLVVLM